MNDNDSAQSTPDATNGQRCELCGKPIHPETMAATEGTEVYCSLECWASDCGRLDGSIAHWAGYYEGM